jgi:hypothetical integral membrane protein (TIGR02206 family)
MPLFGTSHLAVFAATLSVFLILLVVVRHGTRRDQIASAWVLALVLIACKIITFSRAAALGYLTPQNGLPMHLCDWATAWVVIALLSGRKLPAELGYFWGLAGTAQAIITPDLHFDFPSPEFLLFFISHCGIVVGAIHALIVHRHAIVLASAIRAWVGLQAYAVCVVFVNAATGSNYGYLSAKPSRASLLDLFGPWPWYILVLEVAALAFFGALYLAARFMMRRETALAIDMSNVDVR